MTTPEQPRHDEHGRPTGGVRGAINDLLGRGDHTADDHRAEDRRAEDERLAPERGGATPAAGPGGEPQPRRDDLVGADPRPHGTGDRRPDDLFDAAPGGARSGDVGPGHADPAARTSPGRPAPAHTGTAQPGPAQPGPAHTGTAQPGPAQPGPVRHEPTQHEPARPGSHRPDTGPGAGATGGLGTPGDPSATGHAAGDPSATGHGTRDTIPTGSGAGSVAGTSRGEDAEGRERLVSTDRASSYASRWDSVKGEFVDEPRKAVADADALVGELLEELQTLFTEQRRGIEQGLASDETSTEDMRLALRRYRSFFDRLLSI